MSWLYVVLPHGAVAHVVLTGRGTMAGRTLCGVLVAGGAQRFDEQPADVRRCTKCEGLEPRPLTEVLR